MDSIILLVRPYDLHILNESIGFEKLKNTPIYSFNAEATQFAFQNGLKKVRLIENTKPIELTHNRIHLLADRAARAVDFESGMLKKIYFNLDYNYNGWEYLNFYYFIYTKKRYESLLEGLINLLPDANEVIIVWTENEQDYYFDSKILRALLAEELLKKYKKVSGYTNNKYDYFKGNAFDNCFAMPNGEFNKIVNLPATFYDSKKYLSKIKNTNFLDLESPYFDIIYSGDRGLLSMPINFNDLKYENYKYNYLNLINSAIGSAEKSVLQDQSIRFYKRSIFQLENLIKISSMACIENICSIDVTDVDVGLQGPIFSIAEKYSIPLNYWPHSKITASVLPVSKKISVSKYWPLNDGMDLKAFSKLGYGEFKYVDKLSKNKTQNKEPNNVLLIHNEIDDNAGFPLIIFEKFLIDYKKLIKYLKNLGLDIRSRQKPSHSYKNLIPNITDELEGPIDSILEWPDICISIGVPTTALINFWEKNKHCIHLTYYELTEIEKETLPSDVTIFNLNDEIWLKNIDEYFKRNFNLT